MHPHPYSAKSNNFPLSSPRKLGQIASNFPLLPHASSADPMEKSAGIPPSDPPNEKIASMDEMVMEIGIRIPPSDPARLVCFALASKNWLKVLTGEKFRQAYGRRHGRPPFVGYFHSCHSPASGENRFVPIAAPSPPFSPNVGTQLVCARRPEGSCFTTGVV